MSDFAIPADWLGISADVFFKVPMQTKGGDMGFPHASGILRADIPGAVIFLIADREVLLPKENIQQIARAAAVTPAKITDIAAVRNLGLIK